MARDSLQLTAAFWALGMAALLVILSLVPPHLGIPPVLLTLFTGIWVFGAVMIMRVPIFGASGTALWGVLSGAQSAVMHGFTGQNALVVAGSFAGAALAAWLLARLLRVRRAGAA